MSGANAEDNINEESAFEGTFSSPKEGLEDLLRELRPDPQAETAMGGPSSTDPGFDRCFNKFDRCFNKFDRCFNKFDRN